MSDLLVHLHIYYHDQIDYFIEKLKNITGVSWDLIVTYSQWNDETGEKLRKLKPDVKFMEVDNFGYDVWPFIKALKSVDLDDYKYVIKLHTKQSVRKVVPNGIALKGFGWRNALVDGMLYSKEYFLKIIDEFEKNRDIGMISNLSTFCGYDHYKTVVRNELERLNLSRQQKNVCIGTMFIARSNILKILQTDLIREKFFIEPPVSGTHFGYAHLYERIISHLPVNFGYRHVALTPRKSDFYKIKVIKAIDPFFKFIFCMERKGPARRKFIRIFGIEFYVDKKNDNVEFPWESINENAEK